MVLTYLDYAVIRLLIPPPKFAHPLGSGVLLFKEMLLCGFLFSIVPVVWLVVQRTPGDCGPFRGTERTLHSCTHTNRQGDEGYFKVEFPLLHLVFVSHFCFPFLRHLLNRRHGGCEAASRPRRDVVLCGFGRLCRARTYPARGPRVRPTSTKEQHPRKKKKIKTK